MYTQSIQAVQLKTKRNLTQTSQSGHFILGIDPHAINEVQKRFIYLFSKRKPEPPWDYKNKRLKKHILCLQA